MQSVKTRFDDIFAATSYTKALDAIKTYRNEKAKDIKVLAAELEEVGPRLGFVFAHALIAEQANDFGTTGAVDNLFAADAAVGAEASAVELPAGWRGFGCLDELVVGDLDSSIDAFLFGKNRVNELVDGDLVMIVGFGHLGEIGECSTVEFDGLLDQFPTNAGDDLLSPGVEQAGITHSADGGHAAELAAAFQQKCFGSGAPGLDSGDGAGGASSDDYDIDVRGQVGGEFFWFAANVGAIATGERDMRGAGNGHAGYAVLDEPASTGR